MVDLWYPFEALLSFVLVTRLYLTITIILPCAAAAPKEKACCIVYSGHFHLFLGRRRHWFSIEEANILLSKHKPLQQSYLKLFFKLKQEQLLSVRIPLLSAAIEPTENGTGQQERSVDVNN